MSPRGVTRLHSGRGRRLGGAPASVAIVAAVAARVGMGLGSP